MLDISAHIQRLKDGDVASFEVLYSEWAGKVYSFALKLSYGNRYQAEEVVQAVFIKVWEIRHTLDSDKSFGALLFTIAKNLIINHYQRKIHEDLYKQITCRELHELERTNISIDKELDAEFLEHIIDELINQLPPARRKIFILSRKHFLSNKEIANQLSISTNTVESQMTKSLSFLRGKLSQYVSLLAILILEFIY